jgi:hypothetical protein
MLRCLLGGEAPAFDAPGPGLRMPPMSRLALLLLRSLPRRSGTTTLPG